MFVWRARLPHSQTRVNWYRRCWCARSSGASLIGDSKLWWCGCACWLRCTLQNIQGQSRIKLIWIEFSHRWASDGSRPWSHCWGGSLQPVCTKDERKSTTESISWMDLHWGFSTEDLWSCLRWSLVEHTTLIEFSYRVEKCCCLQREDSHRPWRRVSLHSSRYPPPVHDIFCWLSFLEQRSRESHRLFLAFSLSYRCYLARNRRSWDCFSSRWVSFMVSDLDARCSGDEDMRLHWWSVWNIGRLRVLQLWYASQCSQTALHSPHTPSPKINAD